MGPGVPASTPVPPPAYPSRGGLGARMPGSLAAGGGWGLPLGTSPVKLPLSATQEAEPALGPALRLHRTPGPPGARAQPGAGSAGTMGSTVQGDPPAVFDWFFQAACPASLQEDPPILWQFPPDFRDQEAMQMVPKFCFPFDVEREPPSPAVQHFTFALTDLAGNRSRLPWFEVFYKLLNNVGDLLAQNQVSEAEELLLDLLQQPLPGAQVSMALELGGGVKISSTQCALPPAPGNSQPLSCFVAPDSGRLPSIPENRNLTELVVAVTDENIVGLFAALLAERRVLLTASKLSTLTSCVYASCALLYPMRWEHVLIPTLPPHLLDYCCAPMPYLIGVHASLAERVRDKALEDVVMMNVDSNTLETPFDDVQALPPDVVSLLRLRLRKAALTPGEAVSRLFLKAQALLFGGYRDALVCSPGQPVTFSEETFLAQKPGAPLQAFHRRAVHLQLFKQFIEGRLEKLNLGEGFSDPFEQEITCSGTSSGILRSYQLWADNLKKGGGALLHSVKAKTQPAVRNMYRSAKSGLKGMQNLLMYKDGLSCLQRGGSLRTPSLTSRSDRLQQRLPITQHFGQNRPLRPSRRFRLEKEPSEPPAERTPPLSPETAGSPWAEDTLDNSFLESGEELDLLSEILDSLSVGAKHAGSLRPSQSLDCCHRGNPDDCFSLLAVPGRPRWQTGDETMPEPQPLSLPTDLPSLQAPQPSDATDASENPGSHLPTDANQESTSPSQPSPASEDPSCLGDPTSSLPEPQPPVLRLSPLPKAAEDPRAWESPCSPLATDATQPSPPESQCLSPTKSRPDIACLTQPTEASSDSGPPENPGARSSWVPPAQPAHLQPLEALETPKSPAAPPSSWQEPQAKSQLRVAELKKCFEG
ncbi:DENN domain-containing protein 1C isoform X2 [Dasypus novemcinctus]|uniref:DENN domain-containing protein 1C isoform X2 n=1 Tax=Dasypus novemcinctus TaxID=9361 RepID=UPI00265D7921|nr:DENN domain-containing protein 1C isoform X2 [Dasypus novemcinctus]